MSDKISAGVCSGILMLELSGGSKISVPCIGEPYASQIAASINAMAVAGDGLDDAMLALLAYRHGDTKHLTQEHARLLYERLRESALIGHN